MTMFLVIAAVLMVAVIAALSYRLVRVPAAQSAGSITGAGDADDDAVDALNVLRDQKRELDAEVAAGRMTPEERETRVVELTRRVHDEGLTSAVAAVAPAAASAVTPRRRTWLAVAIAVLVPVIAIPTYLLIGNPMALDPAMRASAAPGGHGEMTEEQIRGLLAQLKAKLDANPNDAKGWMMLGRGLRLVNDFGGSAAAFEKANMLQPNDAALLSDWADSLGMTQDRSLEGRPRELIQQALKADPNHPKALALAASAEFATGKLPAAKAYWERLLAIVPPDSEAANEVKEILGQLDRRIAAGAASPSTAASASGSQESKAAAASPSTSPATGGATKAGPPSVAAITGTVKIAPGVASNIAPGDTLFIFARAVDGPRMPLAIIRGKAGDLPKSYRLDDSMAMAGGPSLSSIAQVKVEARISRSGEAMARPGDLRGESVVVTPGMKDVDVTIDTVVR